MTKMQITITPDMPGIDLEEEEVLDLTVDE